MADRDTIVAISTPPGRGGIGAVRLSGPRAAVIAARLFRDAAGARGGEGGGTGARLRFGRVVSAAGEPIDHGYLATFEPPRTFTGERCAELWVHGSVAVLRLLVSEAILLGARPATPGEFSLRAFLNGRIDITQAEAIRDLIEARTAFQAKVAHDQVMGRISREVNALKDRLADVVARLEAAIEFGEEGESDRFVPAGGLLASAREVRAAIERLASTFERGRWVRDGSRVAIVGSPNAGKSSLFNALLEEERAIVTPIAGTTRDLLEETLDLGGIPVTLLDTAGIQTPRDEADAEAVRRARGAVDGADLLLLVLDRARPINAEERHLLGSTEPRRTIVVLNKIDLPPDPSDGGAGLLGRHLSVEVSARTGAGIAVLRLRMEERVTAAAVTSREQAFVTNARHRDLLMKSAEALRRADDGACAGVADEYLLVDLRDGLDRLGEITGAVDIEGIYERIFSTFCIGK
jgi:tRNA modification GTPase